MRGFALLIYIVRIYNKNINRYTYVPIYIAIKLQ